MRSNGIFLFLHSNIKFGHISDSTKIEISVSGREDFHLLSIDAKIYTVKNETKIYVEKSDFDIQVANINNYNFYKTLKDKLLWGKDKRN